jgi:hypothetical protein
MTITAGVLAFAAYALISVTQPPAVHPAEGPRITPTRAEGPRITIDVGVDTAEFGAPPQLQAADFEIRTGGLEVPVASLTVNKQPLRIVLLLDLTASVSRRYDKGDFEEEIRKLFIDGLQAGEEARIGGFAQELHLSPAFSRDGRVLRKALDAAFSHKKETTYGPSPIWDHTYTVVDELARAEGRRSIILFTDGRATGNRRSIHDLAERCIQAGVSLNVLSYDRQVYIRQDETSAVVVRPRNPLLWIAEVTGGRLLGPSDTGQIDVSGMNINQMRKSIADAGKIIGPGTLIGELLAGLRRVYTLEFPAPVSDGKFYALDVRVKRTDATVRAPRAYRAPSR